VPFCKGLRRDRQPRNLVWGDSLPPDLLPVNAVIPTHAPQAGESGLPCSAGDARSDRGRQTAKRGTAHQVSTVSRAPTKKPRVLIADDNDEIVEQVRSTLRKDFEVVGVVSNGQALIEAAVQIRPDAIVCDISMPVLNGLEAIRRLKERGTTAAIVFLTIYRDAEFVDAAFGAGALGYVLKVHLNSDLIPAIRSALAGQRFVSPSISRP
jgi:CheY-like chemotaxis protein